MSSSTTIYRFGPFRLDVENRRLTTTNGEGDDVPLLGKAFDTLVLLVENANELKKTQWLVDQLWPDVAVEPNNLQQNVSAIRKALGDAEGVEIETVRGQGYRLRADVKVVAPATAPAPATPPTPEKTLPQVTQFCAAHDGTRLAYARLGDSSKPPIVKAANWLSHVELDAASIVWRHWLKRLSRDHSLVRYDARGNGLSDWTPKTITSEDFVRDLEVVFDAACVGVDRPAPVLGISQGAAVAVAYAARHPERVSALILVGGCARGWRVKQHPQLKERFEALMVLMRQGWGTESDVFRQIFTSSFFPDGEKEILDWFNDLQRRTTSPENAAKILSALGDVDVRADLAKINIPTLVVHARGDLIVPRKDGIELATGIRGARFVELDSKNHLLLESEPAWTRFDEELTAFLSSIK